MRPIEFRGKTESGEWVYGTGIVYPIINAYQTTKAEIIQSVSYDELDSYSAMYCGEEVIPETVGAYTGVVDCNGKKIFEGDVIELIALSQSEQEIAHIQTQVKWDDVATGFCFEYNKDGCEDFLDSLPRKDKNSYTSFYQSCYIVGNIHEGKFKEEKK